MKIAVVTPIPTPYRDPFWNVVARQPGVELSVFYCSAGKGDRPWQRDWKQEFHAEVLPGRNLASWRGAEASCMWNSGIRQRLERGGFDALIIGGYNHPTMWQAMRFAVRRRVPFYLMCETWRQQPRGGLKGWLKQRVMRWIIDHAAGALPTGERAADYLRSYGMPSERMTFVPNAPDVQAIAAAAQSLRSRREELRRQHRLDAGPVTLFAGRLIPKKRAGLLLEAFAAAGSEGQLVIIGDGPLRGELEAQVPLLGVAGRVRFTGFLQPAEMPAWYALADRFVLPSSETWGVVVLEALAAGVEVIVSDEVGCVSDVLRDSAFGVTVRAGDLGSLTAALKRPLQPAAPGAWLTRMPEFRYEHIAGRMLSLISAGVKPAASVTAEITAPIPASAR